MRTIHKGLIAGVAAGSALLVGSRRLQTDERAAELRADDKLSLGRSEARANVAPALLMGAAGIGAGYLRRGAPNTTFGQALIFGSVGLVASAGTSMMINAGSNPEGYMAATGIMGAAALGGYAAGVSTQTNVRLVKGTGIAAATAGAMLLAPSVVAKVSDLVTRGRASVADDGA